MKLLYSPYEIDDDVKRIDFLRVHSWLTKSYWSPGISMEKVQRAASHSFLVIGTYLDNEQIGYLRVVSDSIRFAYILDVYVEKDHRGKGIGQALVQFALNHPSLQDVPQWTLRTRDAHEVYRRVGFSPIARVESWLEYLPSAKTSENR